MASQIDRAVSELRRSILAGDILPGARIVEMQYSAKLDVSRTPLRIALGELEREGLVERLPSRGFRVRAFTFEQIADAIDVRGVLEGMAARRVAELGPDAELLTALRACIDTGRILLDDCQRSTQPVDAQKWPEMNRRFHMLLVEAAGNASLTSALAHVAKTPLAGAGALTLPGVLPALETPFVERAQSDHEELLAALLAREGARAEALMREHAHRSRENKRTLISSLKKSG